MGQTPLEIAHAIKKLCGKNKTVKQVVARCEVSLGSAYKYLTLLRLTKYVQDLIAEQVPGAKRLYVSIGLLLVNLSPALQNKVAEEAIKEGLTVSEAERLIARLTQNTDRKRHFDRLVTAINRWRNETDEWLEYNTMFYARITADQSVASCQITNDNIDVCLDNLRQIKEVLNEIVEAKKNVS